MIRLIAADMDDTLLDSHGQLPEECVRSLKRAMERGIKVCLASGRMLPAMTEYEQRIGVNAPMILFNGSATVEPFTHAPIALRGVPKDIARDIARMAEENDLYIQAYSMDKYYCESVTEYTRAYAASVGVEGTPVGRRLSEFIDFDCCKLLAIASPEKIRELQPRFIERYGDRMNFMQSKPKYLEIVAAGTDKGYALKELAGRLGIDRSEIAAFGDGQNDVSMLEYAGLGYAMAGSRAAQSISLTCPSPDEAGVAQAVDSILARERA